MLNEKMAIRDIPRLDRPREKLVARGVEAPPDRVSFEDLMRVKGMGLARAAQIVAAFEPARRYLLRGRVRIREAEDVLPFVQGIRDKQQGYL